MCVCVRKKLKVLNKLIAEPEIKKGQKFFVFIKKKKTKRNSVTGLSDLNKWVSK